MSGGVAGKWVAYAGSTPTRIFFSLGNTLSLFFLFLFTTPFVMLHRDLKGKEIKVSLDFVFKSFFHVVLI